MKAFCPLFLILLMTLNGCAKDHAYNPDFSSFGLSKFEDLGPSTGWSDFHAELTRNMGFAFEADKNSFEKRELAHFTLLNNSDEPCMVFDSVPDLMIPDRWEKVAADPVIAARGFIDDEVYIISMMFIYPGDFTEEERQDLLWLKPGEKMEFNVGLPPFNGKFQLDLLCYTSHGEPLRLASTIFTIE